MPWSTLMAQFLKRIPIHPRIISVIKSAHSFGCELRIVCDENVFFIATVLKHLGLRDCFSEIKTNPGFVDEQGKLRISPYHDFTQSSYGYNRCPPNMCKGLVMERIQAAISKEEGKKKIIYLGDGIADYCPCLKLTKSDYMMPRKNYPVWDLICKNPILIKAEIHEWADGEEFESILLQIIEEISVEEINGNSDALFLADCKLQTMSIAAYQTLSKALSVSH